MASAGVGEGAADLRAGAGVLLWPGRAAGWLVHAGGGCIERLSPARFEDDLSHALSVRPEHVRFFLCLFAGALLRRPYCSEFHENTDFAGFFTSFYTTVYFLLLYSYCILIIC